MPRLRGDRPSTNSISTRWAAAPRCRTTPPSRSSCSTRRARCRRSACWCCRNAAGSSAPAVTRTATSPSPARTRSTATCSSATTRPRVWACRCRQGASACHAWMPADNSLEFIGEDVIDHTPRDERVRVKLGSAFDVVGERKQVDFRTRYRRALDRRGNRGGAAQPQGRGRGGAGARVPVPLDQLEDPLQQPGVQQGRCAHDPVPREGAEEQQHARCNTGCATAGSARRWRRPQRTGAAPARSAQRRQLGDAAAGPSSR